VLYKFCHKSEGVLKPARTSKRTKSKRTRCSPAGLSKLLHTSIYHRDAYGSQETPLHNHPLPPTSTAITTPPWVTGIWFRITGASISQPSRTTKRTSYHQVISLIFMAASSIDAHMHTCTHTHIEATATHSPVTTSTWPLLNVPGCHIRTRSHKQPRLCLPLLVHSLLCESVFETIEVMLLRTTSDRNLEQRK